MSSGVGIISGSISFSGLGSETDTAAIVSQLIEVEKYQIDRLNIWAAEWESKMEAIEDLETRMNLLYKVANAMNEDFEFYSRASSSSDTGVITVTNTAYAEPGAHSIEVASAVQHRMASVGFSSASAQIGSGTGGDFVIQIGSTTITLPEGDGTGGTWSPTMSLQDFADALSAADDAGFDVLEDIEFMDDGTANANTRLIMMSKEGGIDNKIVINSDPTNLGLDGSINIDYAVEELAGSAGTSVITPANTSGYTGSTNKRFTFTVTTGETVSGASDSTAAVITWSDGEGNTGTLDITSAGTYAVYQGIELSFASGTLIEGQTFALDVYNTDIQKAADTGLAQAEQVTHGGFADEDTTAITTTSGSISLIYGGEVFSMDVQAGWTLENLVWAINSDENNPGIKASIINDGQGLSTSYHLRLTGEDAGAAHTITDITFTNLDNFDNDFTTTQQAQNAMIKVDGYPTEDGRYIQRTSNQISDVIKGVVMTLRDSGHTVVTVESDIGAITEKIEEFVSSVNYVLEYIDEATLYDKETKEYGIMIGNYVFNLVYNDVKSILTSSVPGLDGETDLYTLLSQIGIETDPDKGGLFVIDDATLNNALTNNLEAVAALFIQDSETGVNGVAKLMSEKAYDLALETGNPIETLLDNYKGIVDNIDDKIEKEEYRVAMVQSRLEKKFTNLEAALAVLNKQQEQLESLIKELGD